MKIVTRLNIARGGGNHGWLKTFHTFAFSDYQDVQHQQFGSLRVINEDRVEAHTGFGTHGHREFEIFSYVISGELEHRDSMGNIDVLKRGDLQMTSAGTGIRHSEHAHGDKEVHFLQIWSHPSTSGLSPQYFTRHVSDEEKRNKLARIVAPVGAPGVVEKREAAGPAPVHSPLSFYATLLSQGAKVAHTFERRKGYLHVIQKSGYKQGEATGATVRIDGAEDGPVELREGDGAYVSAQVGEQLTIENVGDRETEVVLFDLE